MRLTNVNAQRLLIGLRNIDTDESTKLDPKVRMKLAININRLLPIVQAFEKIAGQLQAQADAKAAEPAEAKVNGAPGKSLFEQITELSEETEDYRLKKIETADLNLKDNPKIKADTIARLAPIIKDFDDGESDDD